MDTKSKIKEKPEIGSVRIGICRHTGVQVSQVYDGVSNDASDSKGWLCIGHGDSVTEEYLRRAIQAYINDTKKLTPDERTYYPSFDEFVISMCGAIPSKRKDSYQLYKEFKKIADTFVTRAEELAYIYRVAETREQVGRAEDRYRTAKSNLQSYI
jgi:hypothetical protein